jgi:hypothetical protein
MQNPMRGWASIAMVLASTTSTNGFVFQFILVEDVFCCGGKWGDLTRPDEKLPTILTSVLTWAVMPHIFDRCWCDVLASSSISIPITIGDSLLKRIYFFEGICNLFIAS